MAATVVPGVNYNPVFVFGGKAHSEFLYQDEQCVVFEEDLEDKAAPSHFLVVPRKVIPRLSEATAEDEKTLGHLLLVARRVAKTQGISESGFRVVMNEGPESCQKVDQFYVQVLGGHLLLTARRVAQSLGLPAGYHVVVDENHLAGRFVCLHVFERALHHMLWPVGPGSRL